MSMYVVENSEKSVQQIYLLTLHIGHNTYFLNKLLAKNCKHPNSIKGAN